VSQKPRNLTKFKIVTFGNVTECLTFSNLWYIFTFTFYVWIRVDIKMSSRDKESGRRGGKASRSEENGRDCGNEPARDAGVLTALGVCICLEPGKAQPDAAPADTAKRPIVAPAGRVARRRPRPATAL